MTYAVIMTRKRDGYQNWVAGSADFPFSFESASDLARDMEKRVGALTETGIGIWENEKIKIAIHSQDDPVILSYSAREWTKGKL